MGSDPQSYLSAQHESQGRYWLKEILEENRANLSLLPKWLGGSGGYEQQIETLKAENENLRAANGRMSNALRGVQKVLFEDGATNDDADRAHETLLSCFGDFEAADAWRSSRDNQIITLFFQQNVEQALGAGYFILTFRKDGAGWIARFGTSDAGIGADPVSAIEDARQKMKEG